MRFRRRRLVQGWFCPRCLWVYPWDHGFICWKHQDLPVMSVLAVWGR